MTLAAASFFAIFGLLSLAGGALGWKKARSKASLVAGSVAGVLLLGAAASLFAGQLSLGLIIGGGTSLLLAGRFVPGYLKTHKWMPHGMMALCAVIGVGVAAFTW